MNNINSKEFYDLLLDSYKNMDDFLSTLKKLSNITPQDIIDKIPKEVFRLPLH